MERKITFRGKRHNGMWVYGDLCMPANRFVSIRENKYSYNGVSYEEYEVIGETIGQFTGLKDMIGKDIYEGDIVSWPRDNRLYLIKFQSGGFYASVEEFNKGIYGGFPLYALTECEEDELVCSVVGNIFDNKNLLEE